MFKGSIPALITPFKDGVVDETAFQDLVEKQITAGSLGLVPTGTTGESPTLSHAEHKHVVDLCIEAAAGRVPVIAGAGSNNTAEAIELTQHAKKAGADAVLVVTPYYNKPTQSGLYAHFKAINDCADIPIIIYNIPGRSIIDMSVETFSELFKLPNIAGVKDATGDIARVTRYRNAMGESFNQLTGDDGTALGYAAHGGHGCISVTANIAPVLCAKFQEACMAGDFARARELQDRLLPLHEALFCEASPAPVKYAASLLGICQAEVRLPIIPVSDQAKKIIESAMKHAGLLGA
jgi:4-hydroxy-tetrahydrodipicolinate synthase